MICTAGCLHRGAFRLIWLDAAENRRCRGCALSLAGLAFGCVRAALPASRPTCAAANYLTSLPITGLSHTELVTGRSAASTGSARPARLHSATPRWSMRGTSSSQNLPAGRAWCCAGRSAGPARSAASVSNPATHVGYRRRIRFGQVDHPARTLGWLRRNRDRSDRL